LASGRVGQGYLCEIYIEQDQCRQKQEKDEQTLFTSLVCMELKKTVVRIAQQDVRKQLRCYTSRA